MFVNRIRICLLCLAPANGICKQPKYVRHAASSALDALSVPHSAFFERNVLAQVMAPSQTIHKHSAKDLLMPAIWFSLQKLPNLDPPVKTLHACRCTNMHKPYSLTSRHFELFFVPRLPAARREYFGPPGSRPLFGRARPGDPCDFQDPQGLKAKLRDVRRPRVQACNPPAPPLALSSSMTSFFDAKARRSRPSMNLGGIGSHRQ